MKQQQTTIGDNKTGIERAGQRAQDMIKATQEFGPTSAGNATQTSQVRVQYAKESGNFGYIPKPTNGAKSKAGSKGATSVKPGSLALFIDKLGERLAFERMGTRLYVALLSKYEAYGSYDGGPDKEEITHFLQEEYKHFRLLKETLPKFGGDPTAVTPSANIQAVASKGINDIMVDPRTNLLQSLEVLLVAELADNDGWQALVELAEGMGEHELAAEFKEALKSEEDHLDKVRRWVAAGQQRKVPAT